MNVAPPPTLSCTACVTTRKSRILRTSRAQTIAADFAQRRQTVSIMGTLHTEFPLVKSAGSPASPATGANAGGPQLGASARAVDDATGGASETILQRGDYSSKVEAEPAPAQS